MNNAYNILGITSNSTDEEIKTAYKQLALKYHPDKNDSDIAKIKFQEISNAYKYIIENKNVIDNNFNEFANEFGKIFINKSFDFFKETIKIPKGKNIHKTIEISLFDLYYGTLINFEYEHIKINPNLVICQKCNGKGINNCNETFGSLSFMSHEKCNECKGNKYLNLYIPYVNCIEIPINKGFNVKNNIIIPNFGEPLKDFISGDLIIILIIKKHILFKLKDFDLYYKLEITLKESLIGFKKTIKHLDNRDILIKSFDIIKPNTIKCIENEGLYTGYNHGNLYVKMIVIYPEKFSSEQIKYIDNIL